MNRIILTIFFVGFPLWCGYCVWFLSARRAKFFNSVFWVFSGMMVLSGLSLTVPACSLAYENSKAYGFSEGYKDAKSGFERHENPWDGRRDSVAREYWDRGFMKYQEEKASQR